MEAAKSEGGRRVIRGRKKTGGREGGRKGGREVGRDRYGILIKLDGSREAARRAQEKLKKMSRGKVVQVPEDTVVAPVI